MLEKMLAQQPDDCAVLYIDMDSFFASAEQQRHPELRGKPVGVSPSMGEGDAGCVVACSREAKRLGVRTGMRMREARQLAPQIIFVHDSAPYYRAIHAVLLEILNATPCRVVARGIDEMYLEVPSYARTSGAAEAIALSIKAAMRERLGEVLTASIGIASNSWQAKMAASSCKPDGIRFLAADTRADFYTELKLTDCTGIARRMSRRLYTLGIFSVLQLYQTGEPALRQALGVNGTKWYLRLRGVEVDDRPVEDKKSIGHQTTLMPRPVETWTDLRAVLAKMVLKVGYRLRHTRREARGMALYLNFLDQSGWGNHIRHTLPFSTQAELMDHAEQLSEPLRRQIAPIKRVTITTFDLVPRGQQRWIDQTPEEEIRLSDALDTIRDRFGARAIMTGSGMSDDLFPDRAGFGAPDDVFLPQLPQAPS